MNKTEQHKKAIIKALEKSLGVVTTACKNVGIGRTIFYLKTKGKNRGYIERQEIEHNQKDNEFNIRIIK